MKQRLQLKVCGMRLHDNMMAVAALRPDLMGFIFYRDSPRFVGENFQMPIGFPSSIRRVGVFVDESVDNILRTVKKHQLDFVQLHGSESSQTCGSLRRQGLKVIKAFGVDEHFKPNLLNEFEKSVDYFLFDTKGTFHGGNGKQFNWRILDYYHKQIPFFLSGGISPDNVLDISAVRSPYCMGIDINSGVEVTPGLKDVAKIERVMRWL